MMQISYQKWQRLELHRLREKASYKGIIVSLWHIMQIVQFYNLWKTLLKLKLTPGREVNCKILGQEVPDKSTDGAVIEKFGTFC